MSGGGGGGGGGGGRIVGSFFPRSFFGFLNCYRRLSPCFIRKIFAVRYFVGQTSPPKERILRNEPRGPIVWKRFYFYYYYKKIILLRFIVMGVWVGGLTFGIFGHFELIFLMFLVL